MGTWATPRRPASEDDSEDASATNGGSSGRQLTVDVPPKVLLRLGPDTDIYGVCKELVGELNVRVMEWLNK
eukprot:395905-Pyramimonas_sp.AAC.1